MARRLGTTPFRELLPDSLSSDPSVRAAAAALDEVLDATTRAIPGVLLYARLPEPVLDHLAWQLHVEGYEAAVDVAAKRQLIAGSLLLHRRRGTPWAVRTALEAALHVPATVKQWFEYGGEPYFFRVRLELGGAELDEAAQRNALQLILDYKNVRSWLDYLETASSIPCREHVAVASVSRTMMRTCFHSPKPPVVPCPVHVAGCAVFITRSVICPKR